MPQGRGRTTGGTDALRHADEDLCRRLLAEVRAARRRVRADWARLWRCQCSTSP